LGEIALCPWISIVDKTVTIPLIKKRRTIDMMSGQNKGFQKIISGKRGGSTAPPYWQLQVKTTKNGKWKPCTTSGANGTPQFVNGCITPAGINGPWYQIVFYFGTPDNVPHP
jgi:hypothetical protein